MIRKAIVGVLLAASLSGCLGRNALVRQVLKFNLSSADGRWGREAIFVGLWVIPVYPLALLCDQLFINSWEFWSGRNPVNGKSPLVDVPRSEVDKLGLGPVEMARVERKSDTQASLYIEFVDGDRATFDVVREGDTYTVSYAGVEFYRGKLEM